MMKKIMMIMALAAFTTGMAQNTNEKEVKTVKKTITTNDSGVKVDKKSMTIETNQELALGERESYHNFNTVMKPINVNTDINYYNDGVSYRFVPTKNGYYIMNTEGNSKKKVARLYPTSQKGYYIYAQNNDRSFGYFNSDGDFVVESYDPDNDGVMNYVYKIKMDKNTKMKMKKEKMKKEKMK